MSSYAEEKERTVLSEADYIIKTGCTVRECGAFFNISKSKVHRDITVVLKEMDLARYKDARAVLIRNKNDRARRGGMATAGVRKRGGKHAKHK